MLWRLRLWWMQVRIAHLKRKVGTIIEAKASPYGVNYYMGDNYHHSAYNKLTRLQSQLERETTWDAWDGLP